MKRTWMTYRQTLAEARGYFVDVIRHMDKAEAMAATEEALHRGIAKGIYNPDFVDQIIRRESYT